MIKFDLGNTDFVMVVGLCLTVFFALGTIFFRSKSEGDEAAGKILFGGGSLIALIVTATYYYWSKRQ